MGSILRQTEHIHGQFPHNKNIPEDMDLLCVYTTTRSCDWIFSRAHSTSERRHFKVIIIILFNVA
jgi:hypothetical protein